MARELQRARLCGGIPDHCYAAFSQYRAAPPRCGEAAGKREHPREGGAPEMRYFFNAFCVSVATCLASAISGALIAVRIRWATFSSFVFSSALAVCGLAPPAIAHGFPGMASNPSPPGPTRQFRT